MTTLTRDPETGQFVKASEIDGEVEVFNYMTRTEVPSDAGEVRKFENNVQVLDLEDIVDRRREEARLVRHITSPVLGNEQGEDAYVQGWLETASQETGVNTVPDAEASEGNDSLDLVHAPVPFGEARSAGQGPPLLYEFGPESIADPWFHGRDEIYTHAVGRVENQSSVAIVHDVTVAGQLIFEIVES